MANASLAERLLASAEDLLKLKAGSAAYRRRAVSAAYYSVFHTLAGVCTRVFLPGKPTKDELERVYRALEHGNSYKVFGQQSLKEHIEIGKIAAIFRTLRDAREKADYLPPDNKMFPEAEVVELIKQARLAQKITEDLSSENRRLLAVRLLIKDRRQ